MACSDAGEAFTPPAEVRPRSVGEAFRPPAAGAGTDAAEDFRRPAAVPRRPLPVRKRNRLPLENYSAPGAYFLTISTGERTSRFLDDQVVRHCARVLEETANSHQLTIDAYCFMPDHLHILLETRAVDASIIEFVKAFKQQTGFWFKKRQRETAGGLKASPTALWQRSFFDRILRSEESLLGVATYIFDNPVRAGLVTKPGDYPYSGGLLAPATYPT